MLATYVDQAVLTKLLTLTQTCYSLNWPEAVRLKDALFSTFEYDNIVLARRFVVEVTSLGLLDLVGSALEQGVALNSSALTLSKSGSSPKSVISNRAGTAVEHSNGRSLRRNFERCGSRTSEGSRV